VLFDELNLPAPVKYGKGERPFHRGGRAGGAGRRTTKSLRQVVGVPAANQTEGHVRGDAAPGAARPRMGRCTPASTRRGQATGRLVQFQSQPQTYRSAPNWARDRAAFVAQWKVEAAGGRDYSQIEAAGWRTCRTDALLVEAFRGGEDIHSAPRRRSGRAAADGDARGAARRQGRETSGSSNGISPFGTGGPVGNLARRGGEVHPRTTSRGYAGVRRFIDATIEGVRQTGVTRTLFGRERPIPEQQPATPTRADSRSGRR